MFSQRGVLSIAQRLFLLTAGTVSVALVSSCGGAAGPTGGAPSAAVTSTSTSSGVRVSSADAVFDASCGRNDAGTLYLNAEVEPHLALNPARPANLIATWQQDRWSNGAARGVVSAASFDGGQTWARRTVPFSRCAGGSFERASDPWLTIGPTGIAQQMALAVTGAVFSPGGVSAMLVARSTDGGLNWSAPLTLIQDVTPAFNDKNSMTADPYDANHVYAAWGRLQQGGGGPAYFTRSTDGGLSWETARSIYDPGRTGQIIGAEIVVTSEGDLLYFFTLIEAVGGQSQLSIAFMRSRDRGNTWDAPAIVSRSFSIGTRNPDTGSSVRVGAILMHAAAGPGLVVVTWQDSRFSNGARDGIAFSQSRDGGRTWSEAVQINAAPAFAAFTPQPQVSNDGSISVGYFDFRANTSDPATLLTEYWMARSTDGRTWTESRIAGPFNLSTAPDAGGVFVGDYVGIVSAGSSALSLLAISGDDTNNRTDIFFSIASTARAASDLADSARGYRAVDLPKGPLPADIARKVSEEVARDLGPKLTIRPPARNR